MFYYVKVLTSEASGEEKQDEVELVTFRINYMLQSHTQTQVKASENIVGKKHCTSCAHISTVCGEIGVIAILAKYSHCSWPQGNQNWKTDNKNIYFTFSLQYIPVQNVYHYKHHYFNKNLNDQEREYDFCYFEIAASNKVVVQCSRWQLRKFLSHFDRGNPLCFKSIWNKRK